MKVLMVCLGNICRSPLAQGILQHKADTAGLGWEVDSAGMGGWHAGQPPHRMSQHVAALHGIDISGQRARQFMQEDMKRFDRIYFMDRDNYKDARVVCGSWWEEAKSDLLMNERHPGKHQSVPDPYGGSVADYQQVFRMIDEACEAIIRKFGVVP